MERRTMLDDDNRPERRTAFIGREVLLTGIDVAVLQGTKFAAQGELQEGEYTILWIGKPEGPRQAGAAFAIRFTPY